MGPQSLPRNQDAAVIDDSGAWWESRRRRYNLALVAAVSGAFVCYAFVIEWIGHTVQGPHGEPADVEITIFTVLFQGLGYLLMMGVANLCYFLGPFSEKILRPRDSDRYRTIAYRFGVCFSVVLPFLVPLLLAIFAAYRPQDFYPTSP